MATMMESRMATPRSATKKRSKTAPELDVDKRRGRPKIDKGDESAADRRRTQIRMAQRAYRQRKESTLEDLRKRVSDLTRTIELMNQHFKDFSTQIQASDLSVQQSADIRETALRFEALVKDARDPSKDSKTETSGIIEGATQIASTEQDSEAFKRVVVPQVKNVPSWLDQAAVSSEANKPGFMLDEFGLGYTAIPSTGEDRDSDLASVGRGHRFVAGDVGNSSETVTFSNMFFDDDFAPFPIPTPQPSPPRTFNFQESTFARRLHRASLEAAYELLLEPDVRPATYERAFRLSLLGRSRAKILEVIQIVLARGPHEDLDFREAPFVHIGGAGTHYPPRDAFGNLLPKRNSRNAGKIGPQTLALLDNATREQVGRDMTVEIVGYEGEWFDSHDVQGYLEEEKGIFIKPGATFVEVDATAVAPGTSRRSSVSAKAPTLGSKDGPTGAAFFGPDITQWDGLIGGVDEDTMKIADSPANTVSETTRSKAEEKGSPASTRNWLSSWGGEGVGFAFDCSSVCPRARTKKVVIDVRKFVTALSTSGVCLGRYPGYRRKDVDRALEAATVDAAEY